MSTQPAAPAADPCSRTKSAAIMLPYAHAPVTLVGVPFSAVTEHRHYPKPAPSVVSSGQLCCQAHSSTIIPNTPPTIYPVQIEGLMLTYTSFYEQSITD